MTFRLRGSRSRGNAVGTDLLEGRKQELSSQAGAFQLQGKICGTDIMLLATSLASWVIAVAVKYGSSFLGSYKYFIGRYFPTQRFQGATASQSRLLGDRHPMYC